MGTGIFKAIIFDLDGTLLETIDDIAISMNYALSKQNLPIRDFSDYKNLVGEGLQTLVRDSSLPNVLSDKEYKQLEDDFHHHYERTWHTYSRAYSGIEEMISSLISNGVDLAILSNKPDQFTKLMASHFFPSVPFKFVWGARINQPKKPHPKSLNAMIEFLGHPLDSYLYVGDTKIDIQVAKNAGIKSAAVNWGFRPEEAIKEGADFVFSHPIDILKLL